MALLAGPRRCCVCSPASVLAAAWELVMQVCRSIMNLAGMAVSTRRLCSSAMWASLCVAMGGLAPQAQADDKPVFLQWFEGRWRTLEYRVPDFFLAGYDSVWLPPPFKAADPTSAGFDCFDRFDLGSPGSPTAYGTQNDLKALIDELHFARGLVYVDLVMNHNSGRNGSIDFHNAGGYPGFAMRIGQDLWGDFNDGTTQSMDPQGANYNLWEGDLVSLIDIAQQKNYRFIRQPVASGNPNNIPAGTIRNKPDPNNARFYPDRTLTPQTFTNPQGPSGAQSITVYPFNLANPLNGTPIMENATDYLGRSTQWLLDVMRIDGFRLDAAKHIPQWFWNHYWDNYVFNRRTTFGGGKVTPFSFGEIVDSNSFTQTYTRKDGFGNRDALDLNGAGALRDLLFNRGVRSWNQVINAHLDTVDGGGDVVNSNGNNGSLGVTHVFSHDNGSCGNGGSLPCYPGPDNWGLPQNAYLLFRGGPAIVYHHTREFLDIYPFRGFWPREGNPTALGADRSNNNSDLTRLIQISNGYARGEFFIINFTDSVNPSRDDVLVFERRRNNGGGNTIGNVVVAVNDSYTAGVQQRSVQVSYPPGTRLRELTGNHSDPVIDPGNQIPETLTVDANRRVLITVPNNKNSSGVDHHKGYVVYGPPAPSGVLEILDQAGNVITTTIPPDPSTTPTYKRRLASIPIVTEPTFQIRLTTSKTDPVDGVYDDNAFFRIDGGLPSSGSAPDFNGTGALDVPESDPIIPMYENFVTQRFTLAANPAATNGVYRQVINTDSLSEGLHYIQTVAFRQRPAGTDPVFTEFRKVIYVDRLPPAVTLVDAALPITTPIYTFRITTVDRTVQNVWVLVNSVGDPLTQLSPANQAPQHDRMEWRRTVSGLRSGANTVTVVAQEVNGRYSVTTTNVTVNVGSGDINRDGVVDINDVYAGYAALGGPYDPAGDVNGDSLFNINDIRTLESLLRPTELQNMARPLR
jgi:alpha-amylase